MKKGKYLTVLDLGLTISAPKKLYTRKEFREFNDAVIEYTHHYHLDEETGEEMTSWYLSGLNLQSMRTTYALFNPEKLG